MFYFLCTLSILQCMKGNTYENHGKENLRKTFLILYWKNNIKKDPIKLISTQCMMCEQQFEINFWIWICRKPVKFCNDFVSKAKCDECNSRNCNNAIEYYILQFENFNFKWY